MFGNKKTPDTTDRFDKKNFVTVIFILKLIKCVYVHWVMDTIFELCAAQDRNSFQSFFLFESLKILYIYVLAPRSQLILVISVNGKKGSLVRAEGWRTAGPLQELEESA